MLLIWLPLSKGGWKIRRHCKRNTNDDGDNDDDDGGDGGCSDDDDDENIYQSESPHPLRIWLSWAEGAKHNLRAPHTDRETWTGRWSRSWLSLGSACPLVEPIAIRYTQASRLHRTCTSAIGWPTLLPVPTVSLSRPYAVSWRRTCWRELSNEIRVVSVVVVWVLGEGCDWWGGGGGVRGIGGYPPIFPVRGCASLSTGSPLGFNSSARGAGASQRGDSSFLSSTPHPPPPRPFITRLSFSAHAASPSPSPPPPPPPPPLSEMWHVLLLFNTVGALYNSLNGNLDMAKYSTTCSNTTTLCQTRLLNLFTHGPSEWFQRLR